MKSGCGYKQNNMCSSAAAQRGLTKGTPITTRVTYTAGSAVRAFMYAY